MKTQPLQHLTATFWLTTLSSTTSTRIDHPANMPVKLDFASLTGTKFPAFEWAVDAFSSCFDHALTRVA